MIARYRAPSTSVQIRLTQWCADAELCKNVPCQGGDDSDCHEYSPRTLRRETEIAAKNCCKTDECVSTPVKQTQYPDKHQCEKPALSKQDGLNFVRLSQRSAKDQRVADVATFQLPRADGAVDLLSIRLTTTQAQYAHEKSALDAFIASIKIAPSH